MNTHAGIFTCIVCPNSCRLDARLEAGPEGVIVRGNRCKRGEAFAQAELTNPVRTLTTTVCTVFPWAPVLPVRTDAEIPKDKIPPGGLHSWGSEGSAHSGTQGRTGRPRPHPRGGAP